jgi:hypothetical protein
VVAGIDRGINAFLIVFSIVLVLLFVGVWRLNEWAARKLDDKIRELREMEANGK